MRLSLCCSALLLGLLTTAAPAAERRGTDEWIAELDKAFAVAPEKLKPPLLIFPVLGADDHVSADGPCLSRMASFAAVYTRRKHLAVCVPWSQDVLRDAGCDTAGSTLDEETIRLCQAAAGARLYAVPRLVERDGADVLTVSCHGDGQEYHDRTFTHTIRPRDRRKVPGLIARSVHEYLGVRLTAEEGELVTAPQLRDQRDLDTLLAVHAGRLPLTDENRGTPLLELLERNPRCVLAWEIALSLHVTRSEALGRFEALRPPLECPRPHLTAAVAVRDLGDPGRALGMLLPWAASHQGDTYYHSTMTKCAMLLRDERLTRRVLELWRKAEPGYGGCVLRGERLTQWAWDARGSGWAGDVTPEGARLFDERLEEARRELENALESNPSGWTAHAQLLTVARGLGLPRRWMEGHFRAAVRLRPRFKPAYEGKYTYLMPRWLGSPEELLAFGRDCVATSYWEDGIPQLFAAALRECCSSPGDAGRRYEALRTPWVWEAVHEYYRSARKGGSRADRERADNERVYWGVYGGHEEDVVVACQKLRIPGRVDSWLFPEGDELEFLYDRVHARTGRLMTQLYAPFRNDPALARAGVALADGDADKAARFLDGVEAAPHLDRAKLAAYRAAAALGRKLADDRQLSLAGADGLGAFLGARPLWKHAGGKFVCELPAGRQTTLTFPVGLRRAVISGTMEWAGGFGFARVTAHTRGLRDRVEMRYLQGGALQLVRNNVRLREARHAPGSCNFRLVYDGRTDVLQPDEGILWPAVVYDDVPGGFSIQFTAADRPLTIVLSNLHIGRTD